MTGTESSLTREYLETLGTDELKRLVRVAMTAHDLFSPGPLMQAAIRAARRDSCIRYLLNMAARGNSDVASEPPRLL